MKIMGPLILGLYLAIVAFAENECVESTVNDPHGLRGSSGQRSLESHDFRVCRPRWTTGPGTLCHIFCQLQYRKQMDLVHVW